MESENDNLPDGLELEHLYSPAAFEAMLTGLAPTVASGALRRRRFHALKSELFDAHRAAMPDLPDVEQTMARLTPILAAHRSTAPARPQVDDVTTPGRVPTTRSCVLVNGPYSQWRSDAVDTFGELGHAGLQPAGTPVATSTPRTLDARAVVGGGTGTSEFAATGVGAWVRTGRDGPADFTTQLFLNAHDYVFTGLLGDATGILSVGAAVQQLEFFGPPRGPVSVRLPVIASRNVQLANLQYAGFERWNMEVQSMSVPFTAFAGGLYVCSVWVEADATAWLLAGAGVEIAAVADPFLVCQ